MHQRLRRFGPWALVGLATFLFVGCSQIMGLFEGPGGTPTKPPVVTPADSIRVVISELSANLTKAKFSTAQAAAVSASSQKAVNDAQVSETDFAAAFPVALGGAEAGLADSALFPNETQKVDAVKIITSSFMTSLNGRFADTTRALQGRTLSGSVLSTLLAKLSKAAVTNLSKTGISTASLGTTASSVVGNMITGLGSSGVNKAMVSEALVQITQAAVSSLKETGLADTVALGTAIQAVTKGAVSAVATVAVSGVTSADYATMTSQITQGAASALGNVTGATATEVKSWVASVATGSSEGIVAVSANLSGATVASMVQAATSGTTSGVLANKVVDVSASASAVIGTITSAATKKLAETETLDQASIQKSVTVGAASAAQTSVTGGMTADQLKVAITLSDKDGGTVAVTATDIDRGVTLGKNAPPQVSVGNDQTDVTVGQSVTLSATATDDHDASTLVLLWTVASAPSGSTATVSSGASTLTATFQPDLAGTYLFSFRATDASGATAEAFVTVKVKADSVTVYEGKTAQQWLDDAKQKGRAGDIVLARNTLLVILGHFPDSALVPEASYWLAKAYQQLGDTKLAIERFEKTLPLADASTPFGARTRVDYAGWQAWNKRSTLFPPKPLLEAVVAAQAGTPIANEARAKLASLTRADGRKADGTFDQTAVTSCISQLKELLALPAGSVLNEARFDIQNELGWSYFDAKDWAQSSAEFQKLATLAQNNGPESFTTVNQMRFNAVDSYWSFARWAGDPQYLPSAQTGFATLSADATQDANLRLRAVHIVMDYLLWDKPETATESKASYQKQAAALAPDVLAATAAVGDTKTLAERTWVYTRVGNANDGLAGREKDEKLRSGYADAAIAAYAKAQELGWGQWYGFRPAGEAMVNAAGMYHWFKQGLANHNDLALGLVAKVLAEYPTTGGELWVRAYAQFRQGEIYRDIGDSERDQNAKDYLATYNKAIVAFSRVSRSLFPTVDPTEWYFRDAIRCLGEVYMNMRQFVAARSYFNQILGDASLSPEDKVASQLSLANSYGEEYRQLVQEGNNDQAKVLWSTKASPAFDLVGTYKNADGSFLRQGEPWSHALLQKGRYLRDAANTWRYDQGAAPSVWRPLYEEAILSLKQVTFETFGNLPSDGWELKDGIRDLADCEFKLGTFTEGRQALNALLALMEQTPPKAPSYGRWGVMRQLAASYRDEADALTQDKTNAERLALLDQRVALDDLSVAAIQKLYEAWAAQTEATQDSSNEMGWGLTDAGWAILDAANTLGWDGTNDGQRGYSAADRVKVAAYEKTLADILDLANSHPALAKADGGISRARLYRISGHWYQNTSDRLPDNTAWSVRSAGFDKAWAFYEQALGDAATDTDDVGSSLSSEVWIKQRVARDAPDLAVRTKAFEDAIDLTNAVIVNPRVNINAVAEACVYLAQAYRDLHSSHALRSDQLGGLGLTGMDGGGWQTSIAFYVRAIAEKTGNYAVLNNGWAVNEAQQLMKDALSGGSVNVKVQ